MEKTITVAGLLKAQYTSLQAYATVIGVELPDFMDIISKPEHEQDLRNMAFVGGLMRQSVEKLANCTVEVLDK